MVAVGRMLSIGLNEVSADAWGSTMPLRGCHNDAKAMQGIAAEVGFKERTLLLDAQGTRANVLGRIAEMAKVSEPGDLVAITYSGHGSQQREPLQSGSSIGGVIRPRPVEGDETDKMDEMWCLYDGPFLDDRLRLEAWPLFREGVRILVLSDSCNSGTVTSFRPDMLDRITQERTQLRASLQRIREGKARAEDALLASVLLISGCQDNQYSQDGTRFGAFTEKLLQVWDSGRFAGDYRAFHAAIARLLPRSQQPNYFFTGKPNPEYEREKPFQV